MKEKQRDVLAINDDVSGTLTEAGDQDCLNAEQHRIQIGPKTGEVKETMKHNKGHTEKKDDNGGTDNEMNHTIDPEKGKIKESMDKDTENDSTNEKAEDVKDTDNEAHSDDKPTGEDMTNAPVDRGWAWVILAAAFLEVVLFGGLMKCYGVFFIAYQERFKSSASETSLILTVQNLTMSFTGIFVMTIGMKYMTARTSILIGAVLHSLFYIVTAFAESIGVLYFTVGLIPGLAGALIYLPIVSTINVYFSKYRGLANSLTMSGSSLGGLVFGPLYSMLFEEYGYTGTILILSGILLNIVITGVLMRPIEFFTKYKRQKPNQTDSCDEEAKEKLLPNLKANGSNLVTHRFSNKSGSGENELVSGRAASGENVSASAESAYVSEDSETDEKVIVKDKPSNRYSESAMPTKHSIDDMPVLVQNKRKDIGLRVFNRTVSYDPEKLLHRPFPSPSLKRHQGSLGSQLHNKLSKESLNSLRKRTFSEISRNKVVHGVIESLSRSRVALYTSADVVCGSMANVSIVDHDEVFIKEETSNKVAGSKKEDSETKCLTLKNVVVDFLKTVFDISLLRSRVLLHFLLFAALILPGSVLPTVYFAPYAKEIGISSSEIGIMFSIIGCLDMVSRISLGIIADKKWMRPTSILVLTAIIVGTASHLVRFFTTYWTLMIFVIVIGVCGGAYMSLYAVIMMEHIGMDNFKGALGWATMCHGVSMASFFPVTGYLRDETGTYFAPFHLIGITLYIAATLSFLLPFTSKRKKNT